MNEETPAAFTAGLRRLMTEDVVTRASPLQVLGERARVYCGEHYSRGKILDQWESLLASMLGA